MQRRGIDMEFKGAEQMIREFSKNGALTKGFDQRLAFAINESAFAARKRTREYLKTVINEPTPFTLRPPYVTKAKHDNSHAVIQSLDAQDEYLRNLESGGTSTDNRIPFPGTGDKYGNLRKKFTQYGIADLLKETIDVQRSQKKLETMKEKAKENRRSARTASPKKNRDGKGRVLTGTQHTRSVITSVPTVAEIKKQLGSRKINTYYIGGTNTLGSSESVRTGFAEGKLGLWRRLAGNKGRRMIYVFKKRQSYRAGTINLKNFWTREAGKVMDEQFSQDWLASGDGGRGRG